MTQGNCFIVNMRKGLKKNLDLLNYVHKIKCLHMLLFETPTATTVFRNTTKLKAILKCRNKCFIRLLSFCGSAVKTTRKGEKF